MENFEYIPLVLVWLNIWTNYKSLQWITAYASLYSSPSSYIRCSSHRVILCTVLPAIVTVLYMGLCIVIEMYGDSCVVSLLKKITKLRKKDAIAESYILCWVNCPHFILHRDVYRPASAISMTLTDRSKRVFDINSVLFVMSYGVIGLGHWLTQWLCVGHYLNQWWRLVLLDPCEQTYSNLNEKNILIQKPMYLNIWSTECRWRNSVVTLIKL